MFWPLNRNDWGKPQMKTLYLLALIPWMAVAGDPDPAATQEALGKTKALLNDTAFQNG
jgi:hypothetical protein